MKTKVPALIRDVRDDAYTHGYLDALQHMGTTLTLCAELDARSSRDFGRGIAHAAKLVVREAVDLSRSGKTLEEPA